MGRPSDRSHSAQRPGRCERARRKRSSRYQCWMSGLGGDTVHIKAGRKKWHRAHRWAETMRSLPLSERDAVQSHLLVTLNGEPHATVDDRATNPSAAHAPSQMNERR
jgi:hypothetical protein